MVTDEDRAKVLAEMRLVWAEEAARRADPATHALVAELKRSDNWRVAKVADQYDKGIISFDELEWKVREILERAS